MRWRVKVCPVCSKKTDHSCGDFVVDSEYEKKARAIVAAFDLEVPLCRLCDKPRITCGCIEKEKEKGCNRHSNCEEARKKNPKTSCCHDSCCEECFGY